MHQSNNVDDAMNNVVMVVRDVLYDIVLDIFIYTVYYGYGLLRHAVPSCNQLVL